jgi:hypothetical protein
MFVDESFSVECAHCQEPNKIKKEQHIHCVIFEKGKLIDIDLICSKCGKVFYLYANIE